MQIARPGRITLTSFDIQAKYGDVVSVAEVLEYRREGLVEEAAE